MRQCISIIYITHFYTLRARVSQITVSILDTHENTK